MPFGPIRRQNCLCFADYTHTQHLTLHAFLHLSEQPTSFQVFCWYVNCWGQGTMNITTRVYEIQQLTYNAYVLWVNRHGLLSAPYQYIMKMPSYNKQLYILIRTLMVFFTWWEYHGDIQLLWCLFHCVTKAWLISFIPLEWEECHYK